MEVNIMELNMDSRSTIKNLCSWDIYFALIDGGDKTIKANGTIDLVNRDIVSLCNNNNIFFSGTDGQGSHARVLIENPTLRVYVGFESEDRKRKQNILTDDKCEYILNLKTMNAFEKNIKEEVVTEAEKEKIMVYARKSKLNDYDKISFLEQHTGKKFRV
jgi:hypothetical protein